jgi:hypothetical protein
MPFELCINSCCLRTIAVSGGLHSLRQRLGIAFKKRGLKLVFEILTSWI